VKPLRVALVLATSTGGVGTHVAALTSGLIAAGHTVSVYGPQATDRQFDFADAGADFVPVEIPASPQPSDLRAVRALRKALAEASPDIVHAHGLRAGFIAGSARPAGVPLVVTWHNAVLAGGLRARAYHLLQRRVARTADVTMVVSEDLVDRARALGAKDVRLATVAAPDRLPSHRTPAEVRVELGIEDDAPLVLSVGRLHPQKAHHVLIEASVRWLDRRPVPFVAIAGSGPSFLDLTQQISDTGAPVRLLGHRGDVGDLLAAASIVVITSIWEGHPVFVQEAMRAGVPVVATGVGGLPEVVGDGAELVPVGDVDAIDVAVRGLLDDPARHAEAAARALARAAELPTADDDLSQVIGVYEELTGEPAETGEHQADAAEHAPDGTDGR
jgi:glycosyltransferase involved in cell wall biosynthesis